MNSPCRAIPSVAARRLCRWAVGLALLGISSAAPGQMPLIELDDSQPAWRYWDAAGEPSAKWSSPEFDHSSWAAGAAPLGYGERALRTTLSFGPDAGRKPITAYFRRVVSIEAPDKLRHLVLYLRCDDGAVVYWNGREVARANLPPGAITGATPATNKVQSLVEYLYRRVVVPAERLSAGKNLLAVEVHQSDPASSDLLLAVGLKSFAKDAAARPISTAGTDAAIRRFHRQHYLGPGTSVPDGFVDGGRGMEIGPDAALRSGRELIVIDRQRDAPLKEALQFAGSAELKAKPPLERAKDLARYVDRHMSGALGRQFADDSTTLLIRAHQNEGVLLGEVPALCGAGACRHRSLMFKILADQAGLDVALVRGNARFGNSGGGHSWNELKLSDGRRLIVDVMNPLPNFEFPAVTAPVALVYYTIDGKPYYVEHKPDRTDGKGE